MKQCQTIVGTDRVYGYREEIEQIEEYILKNYNGLMTKILKLCHSSLISLITTRRRVRL